MIGHGACVHITRIVAGGIPSHGAHLAESKRVEIRPRRRMNKEMSEDMLFTGFGVFFCWHLKDVWEVERY